MAQIIDFNNNRVINNATPVSTGLELFEETTTSVSSSEFLFIDKIIIAATGSGYPDNAQVIFTLQTGSAFTSASAFVTVDDYIVNGVTIDTGTIVAIRLTSPGNFSLDAKVSAQVSGLTGSGASLYVSLTRTRKINASLSKQATYDDFVAAKEKVRLILYTRKGEVPRLPDMGTTVYQQLLNFEQVQSLDEFIDQVRTVLADDIQQQVPEVEVLDVSINASETNLDKNKLGISLTLRHKLQRKVSTIDLSLNSGGLQLLKEHYVNETGEQRPVRYLL